MTTSNDNFVFNEMAFELTKEILKFSENPSTAIPKIIDEIRELTGAKIVALFNKNEKLLNNKAQDYKLLSVNPKRKKEILIKDIMPDLTDLINSERKIAVISDESNIIVNNRLKRHGYNLSMLLPMQINDIYYGCFIILGLPSNYNLELIVKGLETLTEAFTLIYRYSLLYTKMEDAVKEKTKELKKSEENLHITLNSIGDAVISTDMKGKIIHINPVALQLTGWTKKDAVGKSIGKIFKIINENTRKKVENPVKKVLKEGIIVGLANHTLLISKDGKEIPIADSGSPIRNKAGKIFGVVLVFRDQTHEREINNRIKESEKKYRNLVELAQEGIWVIDEDSNTTFVNQSMAKMLGYSVEEMIGKHLFAFMDEKGIEIAKNNIRRRKDGIEEQHDFEFLKKDGNRIYTAMETSPIMDDENNYKGAIAGVLDITERVKSAKAISKAAKDWQTTFDAIDSAVFILDKNQVILQANNPAENYFKVPVDELIGRHCWEIVHGTNQPIPECPFKRIEVSKKRESMDIQIDEKWFEITVDPIFDEDKMIVGAVHIVSDISVRKKSEQEIRFQEQQLRQIYDSVGDIIYYIKVEHDSQYSFVSVNSAFLHATGLKEEQVVGKNVNQVIHESSLQLVLSNYLKAIRGKNIVYWEETSKYPTGIRTGIVSIAPIFDNQGNCTYLIGSVHDITERKKAEEKIQKLSRIFEESLNEIYLFRADTLKFELVNKAAQKNLGYSIDELKALTPIDIKPEFTKRSFNKLLNILHDGIKDELVFETIHMRKDKSIYNVEVHVQLLKFENEELFAAIVLDISERKKTINKLTESENKYRTLFENNSAGVYVSNIAGKILDCNKAFADMFGYSSKEEVLKTHATDFHPNKQEREIFLNKIKTDKELINYESKSKRKDGKFIYIIENVQLIGEDILQGTVVNITGLKTTELALKTSNEFNKSLIDTIPFGLDIVDMDGNVLFMNDLFKGIVGAIDPEGKCWQYYKDNGKQCEDCPLKENMEIDEINICEIHDALGGKEFEVTHKTMIYKNKKAMLEIFRDITEKKSYEKKIRQLSRGIEQSPEMIVITDLEGSIEYANPRVEEFTGYTQEEIIGKNPRMFKSGKVPKRTYEEMWDTIIKGETWRGELINKRKNGEEYWENALIAPILDDDGEIINFIGIKEDITDKIKVRDELIKAKEKAELSDRLKSEFLAQMSHEIRTPINTILNYVSLIKEDWKDEDYEKMGGYFSPINNASFRLIRTIDLILNMAQIKSGAFEPRFRKINICKLLSNLIREFSLEAESKSLVLEQTCSDMEILVNCDEYSTNQIFANLVDNAIKYTETGSVKISIKTKDGSVNVDVEDTGIGIPEEYRDNIFEEFSQEQQGYTRRFDGNGLGLALVKKYCEANRAEIKFSSTLGKGSIFSVVFKS